MVVSLCRVALGKNIWAYWLKSTLTIARQSFLPVNKGFSCLLTGLAKPLALVFLEEPREDSRKWRESKGDFSRKDIASASCFSFSSLCWPVLHHLSYLCPTYFFLFSCTNLLISCETDILRMSHPFPHIFPCICHISLTQDLKLSAPCHHSIVK